MKTLLNKRIIFFGNSGSRKSSIVSMLANSIQDKGYKVILLKADDSNPGGLFRLLSNIKIASESLINFFGGRKKSYLYC